MGKSAAKAFGLMSGGILVATMALGAAQAQMAVPAAAPPSGQELFKRQCSTCHTVNAADPKRQGPTLQGVVGRKAGSVEGFHYSASFAKAGVCRPRRGGARRRGDLLQLPNSDGSPVPAGEQD